MLYLKWKVIGWNHNLKQHLPALDHATYHVEVTCVDPMVHGEQLGTPLQRLCKSDMKWINTWLIMLFVAL